MSDMVKQKKIRDQLLEMHNNINCMCFILLYISVQSKTKTKKIITKHYFF